MYVVFRNSDHLIQYTYLFLFINKTLYMPQEMVSSESKVSMIISGRGARACDMCGKERARWYCAADEAYLCEKCDGFVHSANAVARRHERVRLGPDGAPVKLKRSHGLHRKRTGEYDHLSLNFKPTPLPRKSKDMHKWCNSTKKWSRIPRKAFVSTGQSISAVIPTDNQESSKDAIPKEDANPLLYDLLTAEDQPGDLSTTDPLDIKVKPFSPSSTLTIREYHEIKAEVTDFSHEVPTYIMEKTIPSSPSLCNTTCNSGISTSLKPDFTSLHWDSECSGPKNEAGFPDAGPLCVNGAAEGSTGHDIHGSLSISEDSDIDMFDVMDLCSAANFDNVTMRDSWEGFPEVNMWKDLHETNEASCNSVFEGKPFTGENELNVGCVNVEGQWPQNPVFQKPLWLSLDYEDVIFAWLDRGSLWVDGQRPQIVPDINPLDHGFGMMITNVNSTMGSQAGQVPSIAVIDRAREARVLRYKEKRLTRLVSKKIRYEVRKLNADRRPRMKVQALLQEVLDKISIIATLRSKTTSLAVVKEGPHA